MKQNDGKDVRIMFRKAEIQDTDGVVVLFQDAIEAMEQAGIYQWDHIYPDRKILENDIKKEQLYVGELDESIVTVFVLNKEYDKEYQDGNWSYNGDCFKILHRLCTAPKVQNKGVGTSTMLYMEDLLRTEGINSLRLDAYTLNPAALSLYRKLGYQIVGHADWRKGRFYLMEKMLR